MAALAGVRPARISLMNRVTTDGVVEYAPHDIQTLLHESRILLIDVREPDEYAMERIPGALLYPLSTFDAAQLPAGEFAIVFHCAAGGRSLTAARLCKATGHPAAHMAGGITAWKALGLPTVS